MRVSQRLDYTLRAVVLLASRPSGAFASGAQVAGRLGLPQRVVEQQLSALARAGLLVSRPGAGGGHALALPPSQLTVADVVRAVDGRVLDIPNVSGAAASEVWGEARDALERHLAAITIESLIARQRELDAASAEAYVI